MKYDNNKHLITLTVITVSGYQLELKVVNSNAKMKIQIRITFVDCGHFGTERNK